MSTPTEALRETLLGAGNRSLVFDMRGNSRTGFELVHRIDRVAGALAEAFPRRPTIGLWYRNSFAALEAFLAVEWLGGARVAVDPGASAAEAAATFAAAGVDGVVTDVEHAPSCGSRWFVHDDHQALAGHPRTAAAEFLPEARFLVYPRSVIGGRLFGIPMSYGNWYATIDTNVALYRSGRYGRWKETSEVFLAAQQIMHATGFVGTFPFLAMGLPQIVADQFVTEDILEAIERHGVTATMLVPAMLSSVMDAAARSPSAVRTLRHVLYGGGPVATDRIRTAVELFGPVLTQVYGRVEGGWPIALLDPADHAAFLGARLDRAGSCGHPIEQVETRLRSAVPGSQETGELMVRSGMTSQDYADADGWCSLGDVMTRDDEGYLYYQRRLDRMINTGYHVYPDEVEAAISEIIGVGHVRVAGEAHPRWGEMVVAYIVADGRIEPDALIDRVRDTLGAKLARYKVPRELRIVRELPSL